MNRFVKRSTAIAYIIGITAILLMLGVWPYGVIHKTYETGSVAFEGLTGKTGAIDKTATEAFVQPEGVTESEPVTEEHKYMQVFVSDGTKLKNIDIWVCNDVSGQMLDFDIYDGQFENVFHQAFVVDEDAKFPGYVSVALRPELGVGVPYIFTLYSEDGEIILGLEDHYTTSNTSMYPGNYDGMEDPDRNIVCDLKYTVEYGGKQAVLIDLIIAVVAILLILAELALFGRFGNKERTSSAQKKRAFRDKPIRVGNILIGVIIFLSVVFMLMVWPFGYWGKDATDIVFSYISIILLAVILVYLLSVKDKNGAFPADVKRSSVSPVDFLIQIATGGYQLPAGFRTFLTSAAIGVVLWYCGEYMNGLVDIVHSYMLRRILIWFFIMLITTYSREEVINIFNAVWLIIGMIVKYFYARPYIGMEEEELLYKLNGWIIYIGGFVIINVVLSIADMIRKKKVIAKPFLPYAIPCFIFFAGLVILANTRWWPAYLTVMMALLVFRLAFWKDASKWLKYLCDGILINFIMMMVFSLIHRPYHTYIYHRYNMFYFTVTMTATHLTMSLGAAACRLFIRYREARTEGTLKKMIPDLMLFGAVASYALFTLSRTAYAAIIVMFAVMLIVIGLIYEKKKDRILSCIKYIGAMVGATVFMFPITFSATRMIPAVFDDPVIYAYEPSSGTIYKGTHPSDERYMHISRFIEVFGSKVLGVGDTVTDADDIIPLIAPKKRREYRMADDKLVELAKAEEESGTVYDMEPTEDPALLYLADASEDTGAYDEDGQEDATNGRLDIFRSYIEQSNMWGHDTMGAILKDGSESGHAHNIYLQILAECGIVGLVAYVSMFASFFVATLRLMKKQLKKPDRIMMPLLRFSLFTQIYILLYGMVGNPIYDYNFLIWYILSICIVLCVRKESSRRNYKQLMH